MAEFIPRAGLHHATASLTLHRVAADDRDLTPRSDYAESVPSTMVWPDDGRPIGIGHHCISPKQVLFLDKSPVSDVIFPHAGYPTLDQPTLDSCRTVDINPTAAIGQREMDDFSVALDQ